MFRNIFKSIIGYEATESIRKKKYLGIFMSLDSLSIIDIFFFKVTHFPKFIKILKVKIIFEF